MASPHIFLCVHPHTCTKKSPTHATLSELGFPTLPPRSTGGPLIREAEAESRQERYLPRLPDGGAAPARCGHCLLPSAARGTCTLAAKTPVVTSLQSLSHDLRVALLQVGHLGTTWDISAPTSQPPYPHFLRRPFGRHHCCGLSSRSPTRPDSQRTNRGLFLISSIYLYSPRLFLLCAHP